MTAGKKRVPAKRSRDSQNSGSGKHASGNRTEPGVWRLLDRLEGVQDRSSEHFKFIALCPLHDDRKPSLCIEYKKSRSYGVLKLLVACSVCQDVNAERVAEAVGLTIGEVMKNAEALAGYVVRAPEGEAPSEDAVETWRILLTHPANEELRSYLHDARGLTDETIDNYEIGWHAGWKRYTIPVRNHDGTLTAARYNAPDGDPKYLMSRGSSVSLYPIADRIPPGPAVIVCEGEWDCLLLRQHGFNAITTTGGKGAWDPAWSALLAGRHVALLYDVGAEDAAGGHACQVRSSGAASVRVVRLPLPSDGDDVTDWFVSYGHTAEELRELINRAVPLGRGKRGGRS